MKYVGRGRQSDIPLVNTQVLRSRIYTLTRSVKPTITYEMIQKEAGLHTTTTSRLLNGENDFWRPGARTDFLTIIKVLMQKKAINTVDESNELLALARNSFLNEEGKETYGYLYRPLEAQETTEIFAYVQQKSVSDEEIQQPIQEADTVRSDEETTQADIQTGVQSEGTQPPLSTFVPALQEDTPEETVPASRPVNRQRRMLVTVGSSVLGLAVLGVAGELAVKAYQKQHLTNSAPPPPTPVPGVGGWATTGSMRNKRLLHSATRLLDGTVLVAAGRKDAKSLIAQAERFDPKLGIWRDAGTLHTPRYTLQNSLVTLSTGIYKGHALLIGGANAPQDEDYSSCELYDPVRNTWVYTGNLNQARRSATSLVLPDGRVMVIGGSYGPPDRDRKSRFLQICELFHPETGTWTPVNATLALGREDAMAVVLPNNTVLIAGGQSWTGYTNVVEGYDIKTGMFFSLSSMPWACIDATMTVLSDGRVLLAGGVADSQALAKAAIYDHTINKWTLIAPMHTARSGHTAFLLSGKRVLVSGGSDKGDDNEVFDLVSGTWSPGPSFIHPRGGHRVVTLAQGRAIAIGGGHGDAETEAGTLATCELFIPDHST